MSGENLIIRHFRRAYLGLIAYEQPTELPQRTFESQCEGPFKSVLIPEKENNGNES